MVESNEPVHRSLRCPSVAVARQLTPRGSWQCRRSKQRLVWRRRWRANLRTHLNFVLGLSFTVIVYHLSSLSWILTPSVVNPAPPSPPSEKKYCVHHFEVWFTVSFQFDGSQNALAGFTLLTLRSMQATTPVFRPTNSRSNAMWRHITRPSNVNLWVHTQVYKGKKGSSIQDFVFTHTFFFIIIDLLWRNLTLETSAK